MNTKVTSVRTIKSGKIESQQEMFEENSPLKACEERWKPLQKELKSKKWSECPPEMVSDFVRSTSQELDQSYGNRAYEKAFLFLAAAVFEDNKKTAFYFKIQDDQNQGSYALSLRVESPNQTTDQNPVGSIDFDIKADAKNEKEVKEALKDWAGRPSESRVVFNPLTQASDESIVQLIKDIEQVLPGSGLDILTSASALLLGWKVAEKWNASTGELSMQGVYVGDKHIRPGEKIVGRSEAILVTPSSKLEESVGQQNEFTISSRPRLKI